MFSAVSWGPPPLRAKNVTDQHYKGLLHKKRGVVVFSLRDIPFFLYKLYLKQNITVLVQGLC